MLELTRAANYICDKIREYIFDSFRLQEGAILITRGDFMEYRSFRVEYRGLERIDFPYQGLRDFMEVRKKRDFTIGEGVSEDYFAKLF